MVTAWNGAGASTGLRHLSAATRRTAFHPPRPRRSLATTRPAPRISTGIATPRSICRLPAIAAAARKPFPAPGNRIAHRPTPASPTRAPAGGCTNSQAVDAHGNEAASRCSRRITPPLSRGRRRRRAGARGAAPDPSMGDVALALTLPARRVDLAIYDTAGRRVRRGVLRACRPRATRGWIGTGAATTAHSLAGGVYSCDSRRRVACACGGSRDWSERGAVSRNQLCGLSRSNEGCDSHHIISTSGTGYVTAQRQPRKRVWPWPARSSTYRTAAP